MTKADAERRHSSGSERANNLRGVGDSVGVARPVRQEDAVRICAQGLFRRGISRDHGHPAIVVYKKTQDVALDPVVVGNNMMAGARVAPGVGLPRSNTRSEIEAFHGRTSLQRCAACLIGLLACADDSAHHSHRSQVSRETPSINILYYRYLSSSEPATKSVCRAPVRIGCGELSNNHARDLRGVRFRVL